MILVALHAFVMATLPLAHRRLTISEGRFSLISVPPPMDGRYLVQRLRQIGIPRARSFIIAIDLRWPICTSFPRGVLAATNASPTTRNCRSNSASQGEDRKPR